MAIITVTTDNSVIQVSNGDKIYIDIAGSGTTTIQALPGTNIQDLKIFFVGDNQADTVIIDLSTFSSYNLHIDIVDYDPTDTVILTNAFNRYVDPANPDEYNFEYIGANGATFNGFIRAKDKGEKDFTASPSPIIICFAKGAIIDTRHGPVPVEALAPGDRVKTRDHGQQPIRWIGRKRLDSLDLTRHPSLLPIRIAAGALGDGMPLADLLVSPQHRILITGWRAELYYGTPEILVPAIALVNGTDISVEQDAAAVTYYHLLFDRHEIITANGLPAESLHSGDIAMMAIGDAERRELNLLLPDAPRLHSRETARPVARRAETGALRVA